MTHPRNITLRQAVVLDPLDSWLADKFDRTSLTATIDELAVAAATPAGPGMWHRDVAAKIATVTASSQYRAALDAGGDPVVIDRWITETEATRATYEAMQAPEAPAPVLTRDEIAAAEALAGLPALLRGAKTADKADIYSGIGLRLTYQPQQQIVFAKVRLGDAPKLAISVSEGRVAAYVHACYQRHLGRSWPLNWRKAAQRYEDCPRLS